MNGGADTTQGSPNCPASNPTMDELVWNNRYVYGKNLQSFVKRSVFYNIKCYAFNTDAHDTHTLAH